MSLKNQIKNLFVKVYLRQPNLTCGSLPCFRGWPWPKFEANGPLVVGADCYFRTFRVRSLITVLPGGSLEFGKECFVNDGVNICAAKSIIIGDNTKFADGVTVFDTHFHPVAAGEEPYCAPVIIGRNVWIGQHALILPGTIIGDHSVIGASSVVAGCIPPKVVAAGSPARQIRDFKCPDGWVRP